MRYRILYWKSQIVYYVSLMAYGFANKCFQEYNRLYVAIMEEKK